MSTTLASQRNVNNRAMADGLAAARSGLSGARSAINLQSANLAALKAKYGDYVTQVAADAAANPNDASLAADNAEVVSMAAEFKADTDMATAAAAAITL